MLENTTSTTEPVAGWHRKLLAVASVFIVLLLAAGGVLCVTQSIRSCPDWPGCFGKLLPPLEASPILEITHRFLAASSGVLIFASAVTGLARARRLNWIFLPPLIAVALLVEVSYFGAMVVLKGLTPGWAAVDVGSALLAVALIITSAVIARGDPPYRLIFRTQLAKQALLTLATVYVVLLSGVLVAGKNSITGCLGWPLYSPQQIRLDLPGLGNNLRLVLSGAGALLVLLLVVQAWRHRQERPAVFRMARWVLAAFLLEGLLQVALLAFGLKVGLLVPYTITMAFLWGMLVATGATAATEGKLKTAGLLQ